MSLTTRCPTCDTAFHVTPLHLQARGGQVRCGRCGQVFNGFTTLSALREPSVDPTSSNAEEALESEQEQSHPGLPEQEKAISPNLQEATEAEIGEGVTQEPLASEPSPSEFAAASKPMVVEPVVDEAIVGPPEPAVASKAIVVEPLVNEAIAEEPEVPGESSKNSTSGRAGEEERNRREPNAASEGQEGVNGGDYQRGIRSSSNRTPPRRSLPAWVSAPMAGSLGWASGSLILLAVLTAQAGYAYRDKLSVTVPGVKPYLERYCELIECVPPPWQTKWLNIESSDMQSDSQNPKLITISAKVRNYAPHPQAYPTFQFTLIDAANQPLARRTLSPDAYLGENVNREDAVAPHDEVTIMLHLDSSDLSAAGYRLMLLHSNP